MAFCRWLEHLPWVVTLTGTAVEISIVWLFHFLGYFLVVGSATLVDLRILGLANKRHSVLKLAGQLFPWMWLGLFFVTVSGFLMFAGNAGQFYPAGVFWIKIGIFLLAVLSAVVIQMNVAKWDGLAMMPTGAKAVAILSLILMFGTILASVEVPAYIACI
jgi:hypothetical protein